LLGESLAAANDVCCVNVQPIFFRRRHQPRRPTLAKIRPGSPAPAMGPGDQMPYKSDADEQHYERDGVVFEPMPITGKH